MENGDALFEMHESVTGWADLDETRKYRYRLGRRLAPGRKTVLFIMLNPSTADGTVDDPTIRRCIGFTRRWGMSLLMVGNLFAYRAKDPGNMPKLNHYEAIGPDNDRHLFQMACEADIVVAAWGAYGQIGSRAADVLRELRGTGQTLYCLGHTKGGHPRHPLYVRADQALVPFEPRGTEQ